MSVHGGRPAPPDAEGSTGAAAPPADVAPGPTSRASVDSADHQPGGDGRPGRRLRRRLGRRVLLVVAEAALPLTLAVVWYVASEHSTNFYFPPMSRILHAFADTWFGPRFVGDVVPSLARAGAGFGLAVVIGIGAGLLLGGSRLARDLFEPLVEFCRAVPPPLMVPVVILALGIDESMRITVIAAGAVWPVLLNTIEGVRGLDAVLADTANSYQITGWRRLWRVTLPAASPQIMAGVRTCLALSLILMVIAEFRGGQNGVGYFVQQSQRGFDLPGMWAGILLLGLLGYLTHLLFSLVERRILGWHRGARQTPRGE